MTALNPYEMLIAASSKLSDCATVEEAIDGDLKQIEAYVETNGHALEFARDAIRMNPVVPFRYELSLFDERMQVYSCFRNLMKGFGCEMQLAESRKDLHRALKIGIALFDLSNVLRRGGLILDFLVSVSIGQAAFDRFRRMRADLDDADCRFVMDALMRIEHDQQPFEKIAESDRQWEIMVDYAVAPTDVADLELKDPKECGFSEDVQRGIYEAIQKIAEHPRSELNSFHVDLDRSRSALLRMLAVDLALRSYRFARLLYPENLESLTEAVLPMDPFTDQPFQYRRISDDSFLIYSVGPRRVDHGGKFGPHLMVNAGLADLCLDVADFSLDCCTIETPQRRTFSRVADLINGVWKTLSTMTSRK